MRSNTLSSYRDEARFSDAGVELDAREKLAGATTAI
jgi:hypothetical protein